MYLSYLSTILLYHWLIYHTWLIYETKPWSFHISLDPVGATVLSCRVDVFIHVADLICEPSHFLETNAHTVLISHGASCAANKTLTDIFYPALDTKTNDCILQQEELLFSCVGKQDNLRRLCPCRNYIKGQIALCVGC